MTALFAPVLATFAGFDTGFALAVDFARVRVAVALAGVALRVVVSAVLAAWGFAAAAAQVTKRPWASRHGAALAEVEKAAADSPRSMAEANMRLRIMSVSSNVLRTIREDKEEISCPQMAGRWPPHDFFVMMWLTTRSQSLLPAACRHTEWIISRAGAYQAGQQKCRCNDTQDNCGWAGKLAQQKGRGNSGHDNQA